MSGDNVICLPLPRESCGFIDENEAFDVQSLENGRLLCYSYGKEAFNTFWIVVDSFYGTKKIVITEVNKIDDWVLLLTMDSYLLRTFDGSHSVQIVQLDGLSQESRTLNLIEKTCGSVQRISRYEDTLIVVLSVFGTRYDELVKSTEIRLYTVGEWENPTNTIKLNEEHFDYLDFAGLTSQGNLCFFASHSRIFHVSDFDTLIEVNVEKSKVSRLPTNGLTDIFGTNMEHLAKNLSGTWYKDHFYLYTTPNPAVVKLQHFFARLSVETKQWQQILLDGPQFCDIAEVHMFINKEGVMVLDVRNSYDERNIHRVPLSNPESLLHISQFAVNRRHGNLAEMTEEERRSRNLPLRLCVPVAFEHQNVTKYSLSTKDSKIVVSDALYG